MNRATWAGLLAILFWSTTVAFSRALSEPLGALTTGALIYTLGGLFGLIAASRQPGRLRNLLRQTKPALILCGSLFVAYMLLLYLAIGLAYSRAQVLAIGLANYLWPTLIMVFSLPLLGKRARLWLIPGILLALIGTGLAVLPEGGSGLPTLLQAESSLLPVGLAVLAAIAWALYSNLTRRWAADSESAAPLFLLVSGLAFWALRWLTGETSTWSWSLAPALLYMAIFPAWLGYQLWDIAMQRGDLPLVTAFSYFTPLLSTIISLLVLQVQPSSLLGLAAVLVTSGAVLSKLGIID
jgi:drug/metabolite transporter (DMT)-like permease